MFIALNLISSWFIFTLVLEWRQCFVQLIRFHLAIKKYVESAAEELNCILTDCRVCVCVSAWISGPHPRVQWDNFLVVCRTHGHGNGVGTHFLNLLPRSLKSYAWFVCAKCGPCGSACESDISGTDSLRRPWIVDIPQNCSMKTATTSQDALKEPTIVHKRAEILSNGKLRRGTLWSNMSAGKRPDFQ